MGNKVKGIKDEYSRKFYNEFLYPILCFTEIVVNEKGYIRNDLDENVDSYKFESSNKYPILAYWEQAILELYYGEEHTIFDPVNSKVHNIILSNFIKYAIFNKDYDNFNLDYEDSYGDIHDKSPEMIADEIAKRMIFVYTPELENGLDDFSLFFKDEYTDEQKLICSMRILSTVTMNIKRLFFYNEIVKIYDPRFENEGHYDISLDNGENEPKTHILSRKYIYEIYDIINKMEAERAHNNKFLKTLKLSLDKNEYEEGTFKQMDFDSALKPEEDVKNAESVEEDFGDAAIYKSSEMDLVDFD